MPTGSASVTINRSPAEVFAAITDITRTGEWSPECIGGRWVDGAGGPAVAARFEGDNKVVVAGFTVKKWTTTSEVTACVPGEVFEFVAEGYTTWRYDLQAAGDGTLVTESFRFDASKGMQGFIYEKVLRRSKAMNKGVQRTLAKLKVSLEA
jgi:uncharacterized protein YndB with AHSA1/START domain